MVCNWIRRHQLSVWCAGSDQLRSLSLAHCNLVSLSLRFDAIFELGLYLVFNVYLSDFFLTIDIHGPDDDMLVHNSSGTIQL